MKPHATFGNSAIYQGDCIEVMRTLPDNSVDSIVTDPPYGLGFMGAKWDALPPGEEWAIECLRVLKPGGHLLSFGGTRTWHRLAVAVEDAGFEIRDSIFWLYGSGFPKHRAALKPACEPIVMARKPFKGSLPDNEAIHGTGALNIDATRIAATDKAKFPAGIVSDTEAVYGSGAGMYADRPRPADSNPAGRWPANVVLDETTAAALDQQSGPTGAHGVGRGRKTSDGITAWASNNRVTNHADDGGASRFMYVAKAPKKERPVVDGIAHPTVKPLSLLRWLVKLVTPPGGTVLEPFAGSGTTVEACMLEGFNVIAIEQEADYLPLIQARIDRAA